MNNQRTFSKSLRIGEIIYLLLIVLSFSLLLESRTGEASTVWQVLHPAFIPTLFIAASLLVSILLSSEKVAYKLLFVIFISVLVHSFFVVVFPAGDSSGQQMILGRTRLAFDNVVPLYPPWLLKAVNNPIYEFFRGYHFQAALSVIFARMFSVDVFWVHLFLIPVLWGVVVPVAAFLTTKALDADDKVSALSSLLISAFPYPTYFGAISVPNSLGFIFFFYSLYFMLTYLSSGDSKTIFLMMAFSLFSFISHYLTGIISLSLLLLAITFKAYTHEKRMSPKTARFSLAISFIFCASLLPLALVYLRFFRPGTYTTFTLDKFYELPINEIVGEFFLGELTYGFSIRAIFLIVIGSMFAFSYMIYILFKSKRNLITKSETQILFLFMAFLMILVDFRILRLFMDQLPFDGERLWVFRDFIAVPFVALAICGEASSINAFLKAHSPSTMSIASRRTLTKRNVIRIVSLLFTVNVLIPMIVGGWFTISLTAAYTQVAPLQTTSYELEAVKYIEENTKEKYFVIGDIWTIYAGEMIVGILNPRAFYFTEFDSLGYNLSSRMRKEPSPQVMIEAMQINNATVAYFIVTKPRLQNSEEYNRIIQQAQQNGLQTYPGGIFYYKGEEKLRILYYKKPTD